MHPVDCAVPGGICIIVYPLGGYGPQSHKDRSVVLNSLWYKGLEGSRRDCGRNFISSGI